MRLCSICEKRPAKRSCPALASSICPICCARDRMLKIQCPELCSFLQAGRKSSLEKIGEDRARYVEKHGIPYDEKFIDAMRTMMVFEGGIVEAQRQELQSLADQDIIDGVDTAIRTLTTFESGLLYTHQAETAAGQLVAECILKTFELIQKEIEPEAVPRPSELIDALKKFRIIVNFHIERGQDGRDYIRFVSQFFEYPVKKPSLIIT